MIKIPDKWIDRSITFLLVFGLILSIGGVAGTVFSMPYRYESGFHVYSSDIDLNGKNITQFSTPVINVSRNYTVDPYDYLVLVDSTKAGTVVNLSIEHPTNKTGKELKIMRITDNYAVNVESARDFIGNSSNSSSGWTVGNIFYFNYTAGSTFNLTSMAVKVYSPDTASGVRFAIYNNTNSTLPMPYQLLDKSDNISISSNGWANAVGFNGTSITVGTLYWIAFQTTKTAAVFYVGRNQSTENGKNIMIFNQGTASYGAFQQKANLSIYSHNQTVQTNKLVPNIAINLAYVDGTLGTVNLTNPKYVPTFLQSDGTKWW